ncbi:MAG: TonB-dependent receptor [Novosphingobium sp.]|nr:TonB-dependent receptor [Novosphingobium sp.]
MTAPFAVSPAFAQSSGADEADNVIIVTAQRRDQALEDVPMTVTLLDQESLKNAGVSSVQELQQVTSGFSLGRGGSTPQPSIRGITTIINGSYENNVAAYIDGLYVATPQALTIDLPNIENVQILKGPQGTLYGRNATGGAILIETKNPTDVWEGNIEATYGRFDDKRVGGVISGPITEGMGIALSAYTRRRDGYHHRMSRDPADYPNNPHDGRAYPLSQDMFRAKLRFEFSPTFDVTVGYGYTHTDDHGLTVNFSPLENTVGSFGGKLPTSFPGSFSVPTKLGEAAPSLDPGVEVWVHDFFGKINVDMGWGQLRSTTGYTKLKQTTRYDFDGSYAEVTFNDSGFNDYTFQQLVDLNMKLGPSLELMVGGQYFNIKTKDGPKDWNYSGTLNGSYLVYDPAAEQPKSAYFVSGQQIYNREKEAWAVFADATLQATDALSIIVGGRYSEETQTNTRFAYSIATSGVKTTTFPETTKGSKYTKFTPRASIRYEFSPRTSIYASYSKGFKSGEWPGAFAGNPADWKDVKQESVDGYEIGLKHAGSRLRFDAAAFYMDYKNLQISFTNFVQSGGTTVPVVLLQNAPSAEIYGIEANFDVELFDNFNFRAGGTWLHARYGDGFIFDGIGVNPAASGTNVNSDPLKVFLNAGRRQDLSGKQMSRAPDFAAYAGFDYLIPMGDGGVRFAANLKYTDDYVVSNPSVYGGWILTSANAGQIFPNSTGLAGTGFENRGGEQRFVQKGYTLINGSITWTDPSDTVYVRVWGNNLTDKRYRLHYNGTANAGSYAVMAEPRTFGVSVGFKFREEPCNCEEPLPPPPPPPPPPPATMTCPDGTIVGVEDSCPVPPPPPPPAPERG